jgi:hypothetical protein
MTRRANENGTLNSYLIEPDEIEADDRYGYKVVAVIHADDCWGVYRGLTDWTDATVAIAGDGVSFEVARLLFPTIAATVSHYIA